MDSFFTKPYYTLRGLIYTIFFYGIIYSLYMYDISYIFDYSIEDTYTINMSTYSPRKQMSYKKCHKLAKELENSKIEIFLFRFLPLVYWRFREVGNELEITLLLFSIYLCTNNLFYNKRQI